MIRCATTTDICTTVWGPTGTFGVDFSRGSLVFGGFAGYGRNDFDFGSRAGSFDESDATLGGFVGWYGDQAWVNAQVSYSWISYDVDRTVQLGPANAHTAVRRTAPTSVSA